MPPSSRPRSSRPRPRPSPLHVWKFGGASLADATAVATAARRIADYRGPLVVVASALAGITDVLLEAADHAVAGRANAAAAGGGHAAPAASPGRHQRAAAPARPGARPLAAIDASVSEFEEILAAVAILQHLSPRTRDLIVARGERLSATLLAAADHPRRPPGRLRRRARIVVTDGHHGGASPRIAADDPPGHPSCCARTWPPDGCRSCPATSAAPPMAASPRSAAAAPTSPRRCWRGRSAPRSCRCGRTSPAS